MSEWTAIITGALTIVTAVVTVWARKQHVRLKAAETEQARTAKLEQDRADEFTALKDEIKALKEDRLADLEADNIKLRRGLDALEAARNGDLESHNADRRQWSADKERLEGELGQLRTDLTSAQARIRDLEINKARLEEQNKALQTSNEQLSGMVRQWNEALPEFLSLARRLQKTDPAEIV